MGKGADLKGIWPRVPYSCLAYENLRTFGSLLLTNSDSRVFLGYLHILGRQLLADTAFSVSEVAERAGKKLETSEDKRKRIKRPGADEGPSPTAEDLRYEVVEVSNVIENGLDKTGQDALSSLQDNISGDQKDTLLYRLEQAVLKLRKRNDNSDSVYTIGVLIKRYVKAYLRAVDETISKARDGVDTNPELDRAVKNFWSLMSSFGDRKQWELLEKKFDKVEEYPMSDSQFEELMSEVGNLVPKLLTDSNFLDHADSKVKELREKFKEVGSDSSIRKDVEDLLDQIRVTFQSVLEDPHISNLISTTSKVISILSPVNAVANTILIDDSLHVFIPLLIQAIQYVPIPRLEVCIPKLDLLLEDLIIELGHTINHTSFLYYKLRNETYTDPESRKTKFRTGSTATPLANDRVTGFGRPIESFPFLKLPIELRCKVYKFMFSSPQERLYSDTTSFRRKLRSCNHGWLGSREKSHPLNVSILRTSHQILEEAAPVLYGTETFIFISRTICKNCARLRARAARQRQAPPPIIQIDCGLQLMYTWLCAIGSTNRALIRVI